MHAMHKLYGVVDGVSQFRLVIKVTIMVIVTSLLRSYKSTWLSQGCLDQQLSHQVVTRLTFYMEKFESPEQLIKMTQSKTKSGQTSSWIRCSCSSLTFSEPHTNKLNCDF